MLVRETAGPLGRARAGARLSELIGGDVFVSGGFEIANGNPKAIGETEIYIMPR